jgi:membrane-associated phospholipid phosphatase
MPERPFRTGTHSLRTGGRGRRAALAPVILLLISFAAPGLAAADTGEADPGYPSFTFGRGYPLYPSVTAAEWITAGVALTGSGLIFIATPAPDEPGWKGAILFDSGLRTALQLQAGDTRDAVLSAGDVLFYSLVAYPFLVDTWIVSLGIHQNADLAGQIFGMNALSNGVSMFVSFIAERLVARERPFAAQCPQDAAFAEGDCGGDDLYQSFWSGHAAGAFTAAGLTCAHHAYLPLYGGAAGDVTACAAALGLAGFIGYSRLAGDMHYASDVLTGSVIGFVSGFGLPWLLHYRSGSPGGADPRGFRGTLAPIATRRSLGLMYVGAY